MKLLLLQGPPACGKTTFREQFLRKNNTWRHVSLDQLRNDYPEMPEHERIALMWEQANGFAGQGYSIIVDNTNLNPAMVEKWRNFAGSYWMDFEIKTFFDIPYEVAVERDSKRLNPVGKSVIWKMFVDAGLKPRTEKFPAIIFDLDGTLCDLSHRRHFVLNKPKDWKAFFAGLSEDVPNPAVEYIYHNLIASDGENPRILFVSGRPAEHRKATEVWLEKHGFITYDLLLMRAYNDKRDDVEVKQEIYLKYIEPFYNVLFTLDDRDRVVKMWRDLGLTCLQVAEGNF